MLLEQYDALRDPEGQAALVAQWLRSDWRRLFAELRERRPVFRTPRAVLVTRHRDVVEVLSQETVFTVGFYGRRMDPVVGGAFMLARDGTPANWRDRGVMQAVLRREDVEQVREMTARLADAALDRAAPSGCIEVVSDLGRGVPLGLCDEYFGFPGPDAATMRRWSKAVQTGVFKNVGFAPDLQAAAVTAGEEMRRYLTGLLAERRAGMERAVAEGRDPAEAAPGVVGRLLRLALPPELGFDDDRLVANVLGLLVGSVETTSQAVVQALVQIMQREGVRADAAEAARDPDPAVFAPFVREALRLDPINALLPRLSAREYQLGQDLPEPVTIPAGTLVFACTGSAMLDETVVPEPEQFDARRQPPVDFTFGYGHHECLGRHLGETVVPEIVRRVLRRPGARLLPSAQSAVDFGGGPFPERFVLGLAAPAAADPLAAPLAADAPGGRSPVRDGHLNRLELALLTRGAPLWSAVQAVPPLQRGVNRLLVNRAALRMPPRPGPLSTLADYTSWTALTDRTWNARHLPPAPTPPTGHPEAGKVVALFARGDRPPRFCPKSTLLFSFFAQWFTDGFLRSDRAEPPDPRKNTSTHEIDLCQLYGTTPEVTRALRGDRGQLASQFLGDEELPPFLCRDGARRPEFDSLTVLRFDDLSRAQRQSLFALGSDRAHVQAGVTMINVLFLREHNRIARLLAARYPRWDDDRVFETTRNTLIVLLLKIVLEEYVNHITPYHFRLTLDPRAFRNPRWYRPNRMAVEFNLLYRWHSLVPSRLRVGGRELDLSDTLARNDPLLHHGLGELFAEASGQPAGRIGLHNTDRALLPTELASITQARAVELGSYNAYRVLCGFPPVDAFDQITGDVGVQRELRSLYGSPDAVEFFVGLFAEDPRPGSPLGPLTGRMVGVDALSQALTNPLLAARVYNDDTFGCGLGAVRGTRGLADVVRRNDPRGTTGRISMTRAG